MMRKNKFFRFAQTAVFDINLYNIVGCNYQSINGEVNFSFVK